MGRPKKNVEKLTINVDAEVMRRIRERVTLAFTGKVQYGAMSRLVEAMFRKWLRGEIQFDPIIIDDLDALELHTVLPEVPSPLDAVKTEPTFQYCGQEVDNWVCCLHVNHEGPCKAI